MGWRFRKSFSPLPGVRITLSKSGISTSVGAGPVRATFGTRGSSVTAKIPGTGLSYRKGITNTSKHQPSQGQQVQLPGDATNHHVSSVDSSERSEIKSAGTLSLTTPGLTEFKRLLEASLNEHSDIILELDKARSVESLAVRRYESWESGWLRRKILPGRFEKIKALAQESTDRRLELEEQEDLSRLQTQIDIHDDALSSYTALVDEFAILSRCNRIWDAVGQRATNRSAERTMAERLVERTKVSFQLGRCRIIESKWTVPRLENANGGDIYLYPAFVLYVVTPENFALLEYKDISIAFELSNFIEGEVIPQDSEVVGHTWAKTNKDGSPDKRFKGNYQIPVVEYGRITIKSKTGMNEEYLVSNPGKAKAFCLAWTSFCRQILVN